VTLDLLWGTFAATIADRLWSASAPEDRFNVLEDALRQKIRQPLVRHPAVQYAADALERSRGARSVDAVARELGMSSRRLLDMFQPEVGLSPTAFRRIRRFAAVLRRLERTAAVAGVTSRSRAGISMRRISTMISVRSRA
jgi:AraC-like DNA-binding protein